MNELHEFQNRIDLQKSFLVKVYDHPGFKRIKLFIKPLLILLPFVVVGSFFWFFGGTESDNISIAVRIGLFCAALWLYFGQLLIYQHHHRVYTGFWLRIYELLDDKKTVIHANDEIARKYKKAERVILIVWLMLIIAALVFGSRKAGMLGVAGLTDPFFYYVAAISIMTGYLTSLGLSQSLKMVYTIRYLSKTIQIPLDVINEDGVGNFSVIAKYCFSTTLYLTSGALFVPILVEFMKTGDNSTSWLTVLLIIGFSIFVLVSMVYPLLQGYYMADQSKGDMVSAVKKQLLDQVEVCIAEPTEQNKILWETLDYKLKILESIPTYPFQIGVIGKIFGTTLIPIAAFFVQMFLTEDVVLDILGKLF